MVEPTAFTAVFCGVPNCPSAAGGADVAGELRAAIRDCPHGVLVRGDCTLDLLSRGGYPIGEPCLPGQTGAGAYVLVQPCDINRRACGAASVAGPLHEIGDVRDLRDWLVKGLPAGATLPEHLRPTVVAGNNSQ